MIDLHSHILPGIDDGAQSIDESLEILQFLSQVGFKTIMATPHMLFNEKKRTNEEIECKIIYVKNHPAIPQNITILPGTELKSTVLNDYEDETNLIYLNHSNWILIEFPLSNYPLIHLLNTVQTLKQKGLNIILAHPERSEDLRENQEFINKLLALGANLQINIGSFSGQYGRIVKAFANTILKTTPIFGFGSDAHNLRNLKKWLPSGLKHIKSQIGEQQLNNIMKFANVSLTKTKERELNRA